MSVERIRQDIIVLDSLKFRLVLVRCFILLGIIKVLVTLIVEASDADPMAANNFFSKPGFTGFVLEYAEI